MFVSFLGVQSKENQNNPKYSHRPLLAAVDHEVAVEEKGKQITEYFRLYNSVVFEDSLKSPKPKVLEPSPKYLNIDVQ